MANVSVFDMQGKEVGKMDLADSVFGVEVNEHLLHLAVVAQLANKRQGTQKALTRSEVSGGGRKPWKQKGTGRARQGSIRATQWRGGGIPFGVSPRDYSFKVNRKEGILALKSALTYKNKEKAIVVVDSVNMKSLKTKEFTKVLEALKLSGKILFVTKDESENLYMASSNLGNVLVLMADELNCYDIVNADVLVVEKDAVKSIEEVIK